MITRKTQRGVFVLVILTTISFWATREQQDNELAPVAGLNPKLDFALHDFELQIYDENGIATLNLQAPVLSNDPESEIGLIENLLLTIHQPDITWKLTADSATMTADKEHITLSGKVYMQRLELSTGYRIELNTSEVYVEVTPQTASTVEPVSMFDGRNQLDAVGMHVDMANDTFKLIQQVKAIYAVN